MASASTSSKKEVIPACSFFLTKKKRYCRFRPCNDQKYCSEHIYLLNVSLIRSSFFFKASLKKNIFFITMTANIASFFLQLLNNRLSFHDAMMMNRN